ncbi:MAG: MMPL family transporter [Lachnospiraceae bacterium]|nr:MMPL family transporter [Lachnospiraceae bacterium]
MKKIAKAIVTMRIPILILSLVLLVPAAAGYFGTKVNYDMLVYLPREIDTMKGQDILKEEFGTGAFSMFVTEGMEEKDNARLKKAIEQVPHVQKVLWYDSILDLSVPMELLPQDIYEAFNADGATMMIIIFDQTTSEDGTVEAVREIRELTKAENLKILASATKSTDAQNNASPKTWLSGMTAILVDTEDLSAKEAPVYVALAVALCALVLSLSMDSYLIPFVFLASIGIAIVYNMGTNVFLGSISYLTKALAAVLQLGVTLDYSIFLWHSYEEELDKISGEVAALAGIPSEQKSDTDKASKTSAQKSGKYTLVQKKEAMANAIVATFSSIVGSSVTTIAGFIALCFMSFTLGLDIGIVMAKGVLIGVISCVTILPSLILVFDNALEKTRHRPLIPDFRGLGRHVLKRKWVSVIVFLAMLVPAFYGYRHAPVYYELDTSLPETLASVQSNEKLKDTFNMNSTHVLMLPASLEAREVQELSKELKSVDGVKWVLGLETLKGSAIPDDFVPAKLEEATKDDRWQLLFIGSEYKAASDEVNAQCEQLEAIAKRHAQDSMLIGEAPATRDLIRITDRDFSKVSTVSIGVIFLIILLVFRSVSVPVVLVAVIEFGIFINLGIPYYTGTVLPFIASIIVGTIQLGSTVDYGILETTRYLRERTSGSEKSVAAAAAVDASAKSVLVSAASFFAATFGVGLYSNIDMVSSLCTLMARGALISMACVIFLLPAFLTLFDGIIMKTTMKAKD